MKALTPVSILVAIGSMVAAGMLWSRNQALLAEMAALRAQGQILQEQVESTTKKASADAMQTQAQSETQTRELMKLRGEVSQLKAGGAQELSAARDMRVNR